MDIKKAIVALSVLKVNAEGFHFKQIIIGLH